MWEAPFVTTFQNKDNLFILKRFANVHTKCRTILFFLFCTVIFLSNSQKFKHNAAFLSIHLFVCIQDQDQDSLLVKRRNDNHSPGPVIRELVPSSHQRSELSNTILCIFSG